MKKAVDWVKKNKLATVLLLILGFIFLRTFFGTRLLSSTIRRSTYDGVSVNSLSPAMELGSLSLGSGPKLAMPEADYAPSDTSERMVITDTNLSMVVEDVNETVARIEFEATQHGGYMVSRNVRQPEEAPYGTLTVRVLSSKIDEFLTKTKDLAVKVTMENVNGRDVTDQYEDLAAKISIYQNNLNKFAQLREQTNDIEYLLKIQRELINIQNQIDNLKGRQQQLEQTAKLAKVTFHLSSDEWALPYAPATSFRPKVIFKEAVRALVTTLRGLARRGIWIAVYSVLWVPAIIIFLAVRRWLKRKKTPQA